jgi:hypothetical protein
MKLITFDLHGNTVIYSVEIHLHHLAYSYWQYGAVIIRGLKKVEQIPTKSLFRIWELGLKFSKKIRSLCVNTNDYFLYKILPTISRIKKLRNKGYNNVICSYSYHAIISMPNRWTPPTTQKKNCYFSVLKFFFIIDSDKYMKRKRVP